MRCIRHGDITIAREHNGKACTLKLNQIYVLLRNMLKNNAHKHEVSFTEGPGIQRDWPITLTTYPIRLEIWSPPDPTSGQEIENGVEKSVLIGW